MKRVFTIAERTHGSGIVYFNWQKDKSKYIITTESIDTIIVHNRYGQKVDQINLQGACLGFCWDFQGDNLAVITDRSSFILLWNSSSYKVSKVDTSVPDSLSLVIWAKKSYLLAVGTSKGNLLIYNYQTSRKVPILGKHSKRINSGSWSEENLLALTGEDRKVTISNEDGDTLCQSFLKGDPSLVQFNSIKTTNNQSYAGENCVSLALNKKSIFFLDINNPENPIILTFQDKYGTIVDYQWFGEGYILIGWISGYLMIISTRAKEIGQELAVVKAFSTSLFNMTISIKSNKLASCSENVIKLFDLDDIYDVKCILTVDDEKAIEWMEWTDDGQMIAMASESGSIHVYLVKLTIIGECYGSRIAFLSSLLEITVLNISENKHEIIVVLKIDVEPSLIAIGPYHVAICMNNRAWFYSLVDNENQLLPKEKEYLAIIKSIKMNGDYVATLFTNGKLYIHLIETNNQVTNDFDKREAKLFNEGTGSGKIITIALTNDFLIYGTDLGLIEFFYLEDWTTVNVYRHSTGIKLLVPDFNGIRLALIDDLNKALIYNQINNTTIQIKEPSDFPANVKKIIWESGFLNKNIFVIIDDKNIFTYVYVRDSIDGQSVHYFDRVKIPPSQYPLFFFNNMIICQTESGKASSFKLINYDLTGKSTDAIKLKIQILPNILKLRRYQDAWKICTHLNDAESWREFGQQALIDFDVELALRVFRKIGDAGFVFSLEKIKNIEERHLLAGYIALYLENYDLAQKLFLNSSRPIEALEMRQNIHDWNLALPLANRLAPELLPFISCEYATQLEFQNDHYLALEHYEKGYLDNIQTNDERILNHNKLCKAGIARCSIKCGNTKFGVELALQLKDNNLLLECAEILESFKLYTDAALLYEKGQDYEKAAKIYIKIKNSQKVEELTNSKGINGKDVLLQFAKMEENEGRYSKAVDAYLKAKDYINAIRILLDYIKNPVEAIEIVKETKLIEGSKMIAKFFQKMNDANSAIEFLVLSKCNDEAFQLASSTGQIDTYANILMERYKEDHDEKFLSDFQSLAIFYEQNKNLLKAGQFYCLAKQSQKGIKLLIHCASLNQNEEEAIKLAIDSVSEIKDDQVTRYIINYLIGEVDGVPKDFKHLFRLYMSLKQYKEAAKTAVIIANEEQNAGNYRHAHDLLFGMCQELKNQKIKITMEMKNSLMLIHSYLLAKDWIKIGDHVKSAQLLIRIVNNISKFPSHTIPILTSAVVECQRANLKKHSLQFAITLMKPEYRDRIEPKFKKKFEALVRKSAGHREVLNNSEINENGNLTPCPFCDNELLETDLTCFNCRNTIPFCIATGHHLIKNDLTYCPSCHFPSIFTHLIRYLKAKSSCPMCGAIIDSSHLKKIIDDSYLFNNQ